MPNIKISKFLKLTKPLLSSNGERVDSLYMDGSFVLSEFRNNEYVKYNREEDLWYLDIDLLVTESISNNQLFNQASQKSSVQNTQSIEELGNVNINNPTTGDILVYDSKSSSFVLKNIDEELVKISTDIEGNKQITSNLTSIVSTISSSLPSFFYTNIVPEGTGTNQIVNGSIWYNTLDSNAYVYIYDGEGYQWVQI